MEICEHNHVEDVRVVFADNERRLFSDCQVCGITLVAFDLDVEKLNNDDALRDISWREWG